ncbi:MAG: PEP-CTERM sorting domain-containing protein, partial [Planctomycetota bacterium]
LGGGDSYDVGLGLINSGQLDLSGVTIEGDMSNNQDGVINLLGDVVFTGQVSGPGGFFGSGTAIFNGGYAPGASPAVVEHENNVVFSDTNTLEIELAGLALGEFDRLEILQDLDIDGLLEVTLIDGFTLGVNQAFEILDVDGTTTGQFVGLGEGDLVNTFGGIDLFISYTAGDGNDVSLYTVPEPGSLALLSLGALGLIVRRRRVA